MPLNRPFFTLLGLALVACSEPVPTAGPTAVVDIAFTQVAPTTWVPGSRVVVRGGDLSPDFNGPSWLHLEGTMAGVPVDLDLAARFVDYDRLEVDWPGSEALGLPDGDFTGTARIEHDSFVDGALHASAPLPVALRVAAALEPRAEQLDNLVNFVNDLIVVRGDGLLLGGDEGSSYAIVEGCFQPQGAGGCVPVGPTEVRMDPVSEGDRQTAAFPFTPYIAGIEPGAFDGTVRVVNRHGDAAGDITAESASLPTSHVISPPVVTGVSPDTASLGQYVDVTGGGFVGTRPGEDTTLALTTIELDGTFTLDGGASTPTTLSLVPEFFEGRLLRYVINESDEVRQLLDLRSQSGRFEGTARPMTQFAETTVSGATTAAAFGIGRVKQVVWLRFLPTYVESLRHFGLREADAAVQARAVEVVARDYAGVNLEVRLERPDDFALFSEVDVGGPDPNGIGLLGYDNTPGKDVGNLRLYDRIGGVNALTQEDGFPGFGGVFVESLFVFSEHPAPFAQDEGIGEAVFDQLFDPFRQGFGLPASSAEVAAILPRDRGDGCPAATRDEQLSCAVWALGSLIGTTVSHEIAHALGLADPGGGAFHNAGDGPATLMDGGGDRTFFERAEVLGEGPGMFCDANYAYLRVILPTETPDPRPDRPVCP